MNRRQHISLAIIVCCLGFPHLIGGKALHSAVEIIHGPVGEFGPYISPDGRWLALEYFTTQYPNDPEIWLMPVEGTVSDAKPIFNDKRMECGEIAWSPDSQWLSLICSPRVTSGETTEQLYKMNITSREIIQLTHPSDGENFGAGTSWSSDGRIALLKDGDIYGISQAGGPLTKLVDVQKNLPHIGPYFPVWSPSGARLAFVGRGLAGAPSQSHDLYVVEMATGKISKIFADVGDDGPSWLDEDHLLSSHQDTEQKVSIWLIALSGKAVRVTRGHYDMAPAADPARAYLYFSRNPDISKSSHRLSGFAFAEGFHIWKMRLSHDLLRKTESEDKR